VIIAALIIIAVLAWAFWPREEDERFGG